ncbi:polysaccharide biosynthesis C-terminal domain-containing protein [Salibacteraceae bacterium]|jgi:O-antigen/teichoic acid export membrane protein|nr:polysaccharide biosynthesis C-terminal domain-containing protein [Salibacteraceae bacterium]MDB4104625.1 polysaccharide biosynthesis C-terminal domain-containing protein [Salibacteraceae bacterium]MDB9709936.1 polysaccharide biosynthesis C-terminal domain-containing protein [Salibacteraceae bacterium]MDC1304152.1 polysaccharide biosynthesis C-terminal domain-containing protein [Salibacteraceae bacterium]
MGIILRQAAKSAVATYVGIAIGAVTMLYLFPKFLDAREIGLVKTIIDMSGLVAPFIVFGTGHVIKRYYNDFKENDTDGGIVFTNFLVLLFFTAVSSVLYYFLKDLIAGAFYDKSPELISYLYIPLFGGIMSAYFFFFRSVSVVFLRTTVPTILNTTVTRFSVAVLLILYGFWPVLTRTEFVYTYMALYYLFPLILLLIYLAWLNQGRLMIPAVSKMKEIVKRTSQYNFTLVTASISGVIIQISDSLMISSKEGLVSNGIYAISFYMVSVISIPRRTIAEISFPVIRKLILRDNWAEVQDIYFKSSISQFLLGFVAFAVIWFNADDIFELMPNGEQYAAGKYVILFIGIGMLFDLITGVNRQIIEASKVYRFNLFVNIILSVLAIVLNLILIPRYGIIGAAVASMSSLVIVNLLMIFIVYHYFKIWPFSRQSMKSLLLIPPLIVYYFFQFNSDNPLLDMFVNSTLICGYSGLSIYWLKVSPDFNTIVHQLLTRLKR